MEPTIAMMVVMREGGFVTRPLVSRLVFLYQGAPLLNSRYWVNRVTGLSDPSCAIMSGQWVAVSLLYLFSTFCTFVVSNVTPLRGLGVRPLARCWVGVESHFPPCVPYCIMFE